MARMERANLPKIVGLCEQYRIPITWATVGHLFLESCTSGKGKPHQNLPRLNHFENRFWKFQGEDWFDNEPCSDFKTDPEWYCPDLIRLLLTSSVKHEIGNHTFSHIDCSDENCPPSVLKAEIAESKKLAAEFGIELKSFVHPGYTVGNLDTLAEEGFTNFRTDYRNVLGYPKRHQNGIWELEQTMEFRYYNYWSVEYQRKRYIEIIKRAINSNTVCVFWFHPSFDPIIVEKIWPKVFDFLNQNRDKIWITTHDEYIKNIMSK
jgi:peptidoglycan/xylan/chitin deacetylase (PgdA/CDA1 family)